MRRAFGRFEYDEDGLFFMHGMPVLVALVAVSGPVVYQAQRKRERSPAKSSQDDKTQILSEGE